MLCHRMAVKGKWYDDEVTYRSGGYKREEPNWNSKSPSAMRKLDEEVEEQKRLQEKHKERIKAIHDRMRSGAKPVNPV